MLHSVYFYLKSTCSKEDKEMFLKGLTSLKNVPSAEFVYIGTPSSTKRPSIDDSYDYALLTHFKSLKEHDEYQVDPIHKKFVDDCSPYWESVKVYDFDELL
jgi:hypothetical protein